MMLFALEPLVMKGLSQSLKVAGSLQKLGIAVATKTTGENSNKVMVLENRVIGTHSGHFHCDEALACGLLKLLPHYADSPILRTRNQQELDLCDIVVDVGGVYDPRSRRFDHHQRGFEETFDEATKTKLSSAGLIYKHYGKEVIDVIAKDSNIDLGDKVHEIVFQKIYSSFIEHIDGNDNGINPYTGDPNYQVTTTLSSRVGDLNPDWNEDSSEEHVMAQFCKAVLLTTHEFVSKVNGLLKCWLPARKHVEEAITQRYRTHESGQIIALDRSLPWKTHVLDIEQEQKIAVPIKYVLYPDEQSNWRIQAVPITPSSFENRKPLPSPYRGLRDDELSKAWGIPECIFVHSSGFIGANKTFEGALEMAKSSLLRSE